MYFRWTPAINGPTPNVLWTENLQSRHLWSFSAQKWQFSHPVPRIRSVSLFTAHPSFIKSVVLMVACLLHLAVTRNGSKPVWFPPSIPQPAQFCSAVLSKLQSNLNRHVYPLTYRSWLPFHNCRRKFGTPFFHPRQNCQLSRWWVCQSPSPSLWKTLAGNDFCERSRKGRKK